VQLRTSKPGSVVDQQALELFERNAASEWALTLAQQLGDVLLAELLLFACEWSGMNESAIDTMAIERTRCAMSYVEHGSQRTKHVDGIRWRDPTAIKWICREPELGHEWRRDDALARELLTKCSGTCVTLVVVVVVVVVVEGMSDATRSSSESESERDRRYHEASELGEWRRR